MGAQPLERLELNSLTTTNITKDYMISGKPEDNHINSDWDEGFESEGVKSTTVTRQTHITALTQPPKLLTIE